MADQVGEVWVQQWLTRLGAAWKERLLLRQVHHSLYNTDPNMINQLALVKLEVLLERATVNLISDLTGVTRTTLYRWLDEDLPLDVMNHRDSAWFILVCETSPEIKMLMDRAPLSHPRLAKRLNGDARQKKPAAAKRRGG